MKKIDSYWVSIAAIIVGALMIMGSATAPDRIGDFAMFKGLTYAAVIISAGIVIASGILSLTIRQIFDKNKDEKK